MASVVPSAEMFDSAVREEYFLKIVTKRPGAVLDCYVARCRPDEKISETLK